VRYKDKPGIYIFYIEAEKLLPTYLARFLSGLPYEKSNIDRSSEDGTNLFLSHNRKRDFQFEATFKNKNTPYTKSALDRWLTERYCLYLDIGQLLFCYEIHRTEWAFNEIYLKSLRINYNIGDFCLLGQPPCLTHYSDGVTALIWSKKLVTAKTLIH
jgi:uncharacterized protein YqjF (DUF2071 family)